MGPSGSSRRPPAKKYGFGCSPLPWRLFAFTPDGALIATAQGRFLRVLSTATGTEAWQKQHTSGDVEIVGVSPDGRWIVMAGNTIVRPLDAATHGDIWSAVQQHGIYGIGALSVPAAVAFSADSRLIAVGRKFEFGEGSWQVVDVATGRLEQSGGLQSGATAASFNPSLGLLAVAESAGVVHIVDRVNGVEAFSVRPGTPLSSITHRADGQLVAAGGMDGTVRLVDVRARAEALRFKHNGAVTAVSFSSDGKLVASGGVDGRVRVVDAGTDLAEFRFYGGPDKHPQFSSDGRRLIVTAMTFTMDMEMWVFDLSTGKVVPELSGKDRPARPDAAPTRASADGAGL